MYKFFRGMLPEKKVTPPPPKPGMHAPEIWALVSLSKSDYNAIYKQTLLKIGQSDYGQSLSDDEKNRVYDYAVNALKIRRAFYLPPDTPPEILYRESEMWTFSVFYAAMFSMYLRKGGTESFGCPINHFSEVASSWMNEGPKGAAKSYILTGSGDLSRVFTRLSTELEKQKLLARSKTKCQINVNKIRETLRPLIESHVNRLAESQQKTNSRDVLFDNGHLILFTSDIDELTPVVHQMLDMSLAEALKACQDEQTHPVTFCMPHSPKLRSGYMLGEALFPRTKGRVRCIYYEKSIEEFALTFHQHVATENMTVAEYCKKLIRALAFSHTVHALSSPLTPLRVVPLGICVTSKIWDDILNLIHVLFDDNSNVFSSMESISRLDALADEDYQCLSIKNNKDPEPCIFIIDKHYREKNAEPCFKLMTPLAMLDTSDIIPQLEGYLKKCARLKANKYVYNCGSRVFIPYHSLMVFINDELSSHAQWQEVVSLLQENLPSTGRMTVETGILLNKEGIPAPVPGALYNNTFRALSRYKLPTAKLAVKLDAIDWHLAKTLFIQNFGPEPQSISQQSFRSFVLTHLSCCESYLTVMKALNQHAEIQLAVDPETPNHLFFDPL